LIHEASLCAAGDGGIAEYIRERNPGAARRVRAAILHSVQTLLLFPGIGRRQGTEGVRKLVTCKYPYLIYYSVDEAAGEVVILAIQHAAPRREHEDA
jgi:toxin ParE1/3/4